MFACAKIKFMKRLKNDCILILIILLLIGVAFLLQYFHSKQGNTILQVYQNGILIGEYDLTRSQTFYVEGADSDDFNLVLIENGVVRITDANCPDQLCMKQRSITKNGESIICLPHKLVLQICSKEDGSVDAVTY